MLHLDQDGLGVRAVPRGTGAEPGDAEARLEPEPGAHRRQRWVRARARLVPGRPQVGRLGGLRGEPDRVGDRAAGRDRRLDLAVVQQPRQDGQAGRVGGGPARRPEPVGGEAPDRAGAGLRARGRVPRLPQFVERAGGLVDHDRVAVATRVLAPLDQRVLAERVGAPVALVGDLELDPDQRVRAGDDVVGDAEGKPTAIRPEIGVQVEPCGVHASHPGGAVGVHRQPGDVGVPDVAGGEHRAGRGTGDRGAASAGAGGLCGRDGRPAVAGARDRRLVLARGQDPAGRGAGTMPCAGGRAGAGRRGGGGAAGCQERQRCERREDSDRCGAERASHGPHPATAGTAPGGVRLYTEARRGPATGTRPRPATQALASAGYQPSR